MREIVTLARLQCPSKQRGNKLIEQDRPIRPQPEETDPPPGRNAPARHDDTFQRRYASGNGWGLKWVWVIIVLIAGSIVAADRHQATEGLMIGVAAGKADTVPATFPFCGETRRVTCVVDGDTFWLDGEKVRISDIDTPELSPPRCEAERVKGEAAKRRLQELLNAGPFWLASGWRDEDQHGRKLRTVMRDGRSIGDVLIGEGLARRWDGARRSWCD